MSKKYRRSKPEHSKSGNNTKKTNILLVILSIVLIIVFALGLMKDKQVAKANAKDYDQWKEEIKSEKNLSVYEKIKKGKDINLLVIGDSVGLSTGKTSENGDWVKQLNKWLEENYKSHANVTNLSYNNGSVYKGFNEVMKQTSKKYDLAIVLFGENSNANLKIDEFGVLYEGIIRQLHKDNNCDVIPVVENSSKKDNSYDNVIKKLGSHYNLSVANVENGFLKSQVPYKKLVNESNEPNDTGYEIYFNVIKDTINKNIEDSKQVSNEDIKPLYNNAINLDSYNSVLKPSVNHGFATSGNSVISDKKGSTIEYTVKGNNVGLSYLGNAQGGKFDVFINDKFIQSINTASKTEEINYILLSTKEGKENKIKILQTSDNGKKVNLLGGIGFDS